MHSPNTQVYVLPVIRDGQITGWTWQLMHAGRHVASGSIPQATISLAREEGLNRTKTSTYPGSLPEWDRFWNGGEYAGDRST